MVKKVETMEIDLKETKKILVQLEEKLINFAALNNNFVEEEIAINVRYVSDIKGLKIIVKNRAPLSIVSDKWLKNYVDEIKVDREDIKQRSCNRRFIFGKKA